MVQYNHQVCAALLQFATATESGSWSPKNRHTLQPTVQVLSEARTRCLSPCLWNCGKLRSLCRSATVNSTLDEVDLLLMQSSEYDIELNSHMDAPFWDQYDGLADAAQAEGIDRWSSVMIPDEEFETPCGTSYCSSGVETPSLFGATPEADCSSAQQKFELQSTVTGREVTKMHLIVASIELTCNELEESQQLCPFASVRASALRCQAMAQAGQNMFARAELQTLTVNSYVEGQPSVMLEQLSNQSEAWAGRRELVLTY